MKVTCENVNCNVEALVNAKIGVDGAGTISGIIVHSGADAEYTGDKPIQKLVLGDPNTTIGATFTGSANIENVTVNDTNGSITLKSKGTIGNLILPPGMDPKSLFPNPGDLNNVAEIGGVRTASYCSLNPSDSSCRTPAPPVSVPTPSVTDVTYSVGIDPETSAIHVNFVVTFQNASKLYYVIVNDAGVPNADAVKDGNAAGTIDSGSIDVTDSTNQEIPLTFENGYEYTIYVVAENGGRLSDVYGQNFVPMISS
uniref:Uncharacterized protein n=1 Tax=Cohnella candidum TaxID=2674991 RepID=A0A3G3K2R7_9BACL|nr:hypothetical protein EAV92_20870 [Cohnella candidum]